MKSNKNIKAILLVFGIIFATTTIMIYDFSYDTDEALINYEKSEDTNDNSIKSAGFWPDESPILIANNWSDTRDQYAWCNGDGTWDDPYVIENVTINGGEGSGIQVWYTDEPFIIRNCTISNMEYAGIDLHNVNNSQIIDNYLLSNGEDGIFIAKGCNNTISGNYIYNNGEPGIWLEAEGEDETLYCYYNNISGNTVYKNDGGINFEVSGEGNAIIYCYNNSITGNNITENNDEGIDFELYTEVYFENNYIYAYNNSITNNNITLNNGCGIEYDIEAWNNTRIYTNFTKISGNFIAGNGDKGISIDVISFNTAVVNVKNITVSGNHIAFNRDEGIQLETDQPGGTVEFKDNFITGNTLRENGDVGIFLAGCNYTTLTDNDLFGNGIAIDGVMLEHFDSHNIDISNEANNKPIYYYTHEKYLGGSDFTNAGQVILVLCDDSVVSDLDVSNASIGIAHVGGRNVTIHNNNASYGLQGIVLYSSDDNNVTGNRANYNRWTGIFLYSSDDNNITQNTANNNYAGIFLLSSNINIISGNTLLGNVVCINQTNCVGNILTNNNCGVAAAAGDGDDDDDDDKEEEIIPGYDLIIFISTIFILLGVLYIFLVKKRLISL